MDCERLARSITSAPIRIDAIAPLDAARVMVCAPPEPPRSRQRMEFDVLGMILRPSVQIQAPRQWTLNRQ
jgi:hypothetical protein